MRLLVTGGSASSAARWNSRADSRTRAARAWRDHALDLFDRAAVAGRDARIDRPWRPRCSTSGNPDSDGKNVASGRCVQESWSASLRFAADCARTPGMPQYAPILRSAPQRKSRPRSPKRRVCATQAPRRILPVVISRSPALGRRSVARRACCSRRSLSRYDAQQWARQADVVKLACWHPLR